MPTRRALLAASLATPAFAQATLPNRPIRLIIPVAVAGVTDIVGRIMAEGLSQQLGRPVVPENISGAGSTIGGQAFQRAPADGSVLFIGTSNMSVMRTLYPNAGVDPVNDFVPLAMVAKQPFVLAVHPDVPARDVPQLLAWLKAQGEAVNYGATNPGASNHMAGELLKQITGATYTIVPYRAAAAAVQDLVAGRVQFTIDSPTMLLPLIREGRVRGLAVSTHERSGVAPGLPALAESGVPNYDLTVWQILYARPGTPPEIVSLLSEAARKAVADPAVQQRLAAAGCETWPDTSPAAAAAWLAEDIARWAPIAAKVTPG